MTSGTSEPSLLWEGGITHNYRTIRRLKSQLSFFLKSINFMFFLSVEVNKFWGLLSIHSVFFFFFKLSLVEATFTFTSLLEKIVSSYRLQMFITCGSQLVTRGKTRMHNIVPVPTNCQELNWIGSCWIIASGPITSWQIDGETVETVSDFILGGSKITADGDCSHEIKTLTPWKESYDQTR